MGSNIIIELRETVLEVVYWMHLD